MSAGVRSGDVQSVPIAFSHAAAGKTVIVQPVAGRRLAIVGLCVVLDADGSIILEDTDGANRIGPLPLSANGGFVLPAGNVPWAKTAVGKGILVRSIAALGGGGVLLYQECVD